MVKTLLLILAFAQRDYRVSPLDYEDDFFISGETIESLLMILTLVSVVIGLLFYIFVVVPHRIKEKVKKRKIQENEFEERKKEIEEEVRFILTRNEDASTTIDNIEEVHKYHYTEVFFVPQQDLVRIPGGSECVILEYIIKGDNTYVKVKFDAYPFPLYMSRRVLTEKSKLIREYYVTTGDKIATTKRELLKSNKYLWDFIQSKNYFVEKEGFVLIPSGAKFAISLQRDPYPHYVPESKVDIEGYPTPLYIYFTQVKKIPPTE